LSLRLHIVAVGKRMPDWVNAGVTEYTARMSKDCRLDLIEIPAAKRSSRLEIERWKRDEAQRILASIPNGSWTISLDEHGQQWSTQDLAEQLARWSQETSGLAFIIGGADGLHSTVFDHARSRWSLSKLTLPHSLVRILVAEQLYRAWSLLQGHPYHRA
jgi:23S rRNA (pseudouridine1915-N3)-methyltransferase